MQEVIGGSVELASGAMMPKVGLGVFRAGAGDATRDAVLAALRAGYRHIDTAAIYRNEAEVGEAVRAWLAETGESREALFITTKLWNDDQGYESALRAFDVSQRALDLGVLDLYLLHWPVPEARLDSWRALEKLRAEGKVRSIGVSNFTNNHLQELLKIAKEQPDVNQVELHPFLQQSELCALCREQRIQTVAYSPLTKGRFLTDPIVSSVAERVGATPAQVLIRWSLEQGHVVLPKSVTPARIQQNLDAVNVKLSAQDLAELAKCERNTRTAWDPTNVD
ncbi:MAG: aldo/keto reductase [Polyangiaceae bacterium]|nr:aldo/keto reductase [Myxococcales bacterium]MCB9590765.1 aldo/keto reductase [Polyangiaceae bacterium]